jgi:16S rRNA U516 pseudouridylate synthase RsuA-like enzyme
MSRPRAKATPSARRANDAGAAARRPLKTLERVISKAGLGSRTEARRWIHAGLTTYTDPEGRPTIYDLVADVGTFVSPAGRLDLDTSGS